MKPDFKTFVQTLDSHLREQGRDLEYAVLYIGSDELQGGLATAHTEYCEIPAPEQAAALARFVKSLCDFAPLFDLATLKAQLRVQIVSRSFLCQQRLLTSTDPQGQKGKRASLPIAADWEACFVVRAADRTVFLPQRVFDDLQLDLREALQYALNNRAPAQAYECLQKSKVRIFTSEKDIYALAELLLDPRRRAELGVAEPVVAFMPGSDILLLARADDLAALRVLLIETYRYLKTEVDKEGERLSDESYCSALGLVLREEQWTPFTVPASLLEKMKEPEEIRKYISWADCEALKEPLWLHLKLRGHSDPVIADLLFHTDPSTHRAYSYAIYGDNAALLPETEILQCVEVMAGEARFYFVRSADVQAHDPDCFERIDCHPSYGWMRRYPRVPESCKYDSLDALIRAGVDS